jgi:ATP-dependent phosphofructokinase / diphosphate-dependent phosphofructokinase
MVILAALLSRHLFNMEYRAVGRQRLSDTPYRWDIIEVPLSAVANQEKLLPAEFIRADGFGITEPARRYLAPFIVGEAYPPFKNGLPDYVKLQNMGTQRN